MASAIEQAVRRLEAALQSLELAIQQRLSQGASGVDLAAEVDMLSADRARLAESLDQCHARVAKLEHLSHDASRRLANAVETIRGLLATDTERR